MNNQKLIMDKQKERAHRELWGNVFRISDQENQHYDQDTEEMVRHYLNENNDKITTYQTSDVTRLQHDNQLSQPINLQEIKATIKSFKTNTPGESNINKTILKHLNDDSLEKLIKLFNHTVSMGYFPQLFKTATLKLIPKPNTDHSQPINYRPISLLEVTGKLLEKIINKRLTQHLENNSLIPDTQHGFRKGRGTHTAITLAHETIAHHIANNDQVYIVLRDVSKAFDKVWLQGLQYKISQLQLPQIITKLLNNFIINRAAKIKINTYTGPPFSLLSGVPQGSALSPTLYSIYTSDIPIPGPGTTNIQYADDITQIITYPGKSRNFMAIRAANEINKINEYERKWKIKTNKQKFKIIPIAVKKKNNIIIDGKIIEYTSSGKILGTTVCRTGLSKHINEIRN